MARPEKGEGMSVQLPAGLSEGQAVAYLSGKLEAVHKAAELIENAAEGARKAGNKARAGGLHDALALFNAATGAPIKDMSA